jgi:long-chain fatty acid transport protein
MKLRFLATLIMAAGMLPALCAARLSGIPVSAFSSAGAGLTPFYVLGFELGPWQDYLAQELTPDYMMDPYAQPVHVSWINQQSVAILPVFATSLIEEPQTFIRFDVDWNVSEDLGMTGFNEGLISGKPGLERRLVSSSLIHQVNDTQMFGVSAVFATQSFGVSSLGRQSYSSDIPLGLRSTIYEPYAETGYGAGVQLALRSELTKSIAFETGYQSRIDMDEFATYRGVYSQPADLDIPARASMGLAFRASDKSWLSLTVERVLYSEVGAFASRNLPGRFLSLLGDTTSPSFSWDDLTVYSVGWNWANNKGTSWYIDFSSRTQPSPNSRILSQALDADLANNAMTIGFSRQMSMTSRFNLNAAYAPSEYAFGGNVLGITTDDLDQEFELEASWIVDF